MSQTSVVYQYSYRPSYKDIHLSVTCHTAEMEELSHGTG